MSWLVDIAGKAENLLNKIDQNAAVALKNQELQAGFSGKKRNSGSSVHLINDNGLQHNYPEVAQSSLNPNLSMLSSTLDNENEVKEVSNRFSKGSKANGGKQVNSNGRNVISKGNSKPPPVNSFVGNGKVLKKNDDELLDYLNSTDRSDIDEILLLKNEISTQSREMAHLMKNHKKLQIENEALRRTIEDFKKSNEISNSKPDDAKVSESALKSLHALEIEEKNKEISSLKERLSHQLKESNQIVKNRLEHAELENRNLMAKVDELREKLDSISSQNDGKDKQINSLKESLSSAENELLSYKEKAKMILKSKDELISSLKDQRELDNGSESNESSISESQLLIEIVSLKNERELLQAEIIQCRSFIDSLREDNNRSELEIQTHRNTSSKLEAQLTKEREMMHVLQEENLELSQRVSSIQLELQREQLEAKKIEERLTVQTNSAQMTKSSSNSNFSDTDTHSINNGDYYNDENETLKMRIGALSQALLEKQTLVNGLSTEKQLLEIRVDRLQSQLREMTDSTGDSFDNGDITHSVIASQPLYLSESPWDSGISTKIKRAYSRVDSFCCQIGLALRHRPNLRLGFSVYIAMLHLWVFFILFTWSHDQQPSLEGVRK